MPLTADRRAQILPYAVSVAAEVCVLSALALSFRLAGTRWGVEGFALFALVRRVVSFALPVITLGIEIGLPRFVAMLDSRDAQGRKEHLLGAMVIVVSALLVCSLAAVVFRAPVATMLFGSATRDDWLLPLGAQVLGAGLFACVVGYWRGQIRVLRSASMYILAFAIAPPLTIIAFPDDPLTALTVAGVSAGVVALCAFPRDTGRVVSIRAVATAAAALVRYGSPRVISSASLMVLFALPALTAVRHTTLDEAGVLAFAVTIIGASGSMVSPVGTIILPRAARLSGQGQLWRLKSEVIAWSAAIIGGGSLVAIALFTWGDPFLEFFTAHRQSSGTLAFRLISLSAPLYMFFCLARQVIDAAISRPENAISVVLAIIVYAIVFSIAVVSGVWGPGVREAIAFDVAILVLAARSAAFARRALLQGGVNAA